MVGQNIGKYRVLDRIGRGGMGTVFRALDETLNREVAIKILNAELNDPEVARRFRAEAVTVARLNHPGIATIYELFQHDGQWMMVMEFVRGETLEHMVERLGPLSPQRASDLCMQSLAALSHAHRMGVVHRDLKPANLMITESGAAKIMDFGIARVAGSEHLTHAGFLMGTPAYMAPEQVTGDEIDARTDLYAMGVVFYYLVTAKLPFKGETPIAMAQSRVVSHPTPVGLVREGLPAWIEPLLERALAKTPADRFQSADQFREAVRRGLAGLPMETLSSATIPPELIATTPPGVLASSAGPIALGTNVSGANVAAPAGSSGTSAPQPTGSMGPRTSASASIPVHTSATAATPSDPALIAPSTKTPAAALEASKAPGPTVLALGAAVVILGVLVAWMSMRSHRGASEPPTAASATTPPAVSTAPPLPPPTTPPTPTATPPSVGTTPTPSPVVASPTPNSSANARPSGPAAGQTPPSATPATSPTTGAVPSGTSPTVTPGTSIRGPVTSPAARGNPTADAELVSFKDVRFLRVHGQKADDEDAMLTFVAGQISVTSRRGGPALVSEPYKKIVRVTYTHSKTPKWDSTLPSPPDSLDLPGVGFLRGARHWLVLQTRTDYVLLRLDDSNWKQILETFETRTGLPVDRPQSSEK